jgi:ligand-binding SRPBCC domain-containing protein
MWHELKREQRIDLPRDEVFAFFQDAENLERITPPQLHFEILTKRPIEMRDGTLIDYRLRIWGVPQRWRTLIQDWSPPHHFVDTQLKGPYRDWIHRHSFDEIDGGAATLMRDHVRYRLPLYPLGQIALPLIKAQVNHIFDHRTKVIPELLPTAPA